jgi:hypothetical protein
MFKLSLPKIQLLAPILHNILTKKNIILLVGNYGSLLVAVNNDKIINQLFIPIEKQNNLVLYQYFFNKFRQYNIFLLLDDKLSDIQNELIPIIQSVVKVDPIDKFIREHFTANEIVAYNVYNVSTSQGEVWKTVMASTSITPFISNVINYILSNSLSFGGIYFLGLEFITIIDNILIKLKKNDGHKLSLQILLLATETCGIKVAIKHLGNILHIHTIEYPSGKSEVYIQGIIEQQVLDYLIKFKDYIRDKNLSICLILLTSKALKELLLQSNFENCSVIYATINELLDRESTLDNIVTSTKFADHIICQIFSEHKRFLGLNRSTKSLTQLTLINAILFKPLIAVVIGLTVIMGNTKFHSWQKNLETYNLNKKYYIMADEYRKLKSKYPNIKNVTNVADLYSLETLLKIPFPTPFGLIEKFISTLRPNTELKNISWELTSHSDYITKLKSIKLEASLHATSNNITAQEAEIQLNQYLETIASNFPGYKLDVVKSENIRFLPPQITIPVYISLSDDAE